MLYTCPDCKKRTKVIVLNTWRGDTEVKCMKCGRERPEEDWMKIHRPAAKS